MPSAPTWCCSIRPSPAWTESPSPCRSGPPRPAIRSSVKAAEGALKRHIDYLVPNDYRAAISALDSGAPFIQARDSEVVRAVLDFVRRIDHRGGAIELPAENTRLVRSLA